MAAVPTTQPRITLRLLARVGALPGAGELGGEIVRENTPRGEGDFAAQIGPQPGARRPRSRRPVRRRRGRRTTLSPLVRQLLHLRGRPHRSLEAMATDTATRLPSRAKPAQPPTRSTRPTRFSIRHCNTRARGVRRRVPGRVRRRAGRGPSPPSGRRGDAGRGAIERPVPPSGVDPGRRGGDRRFPAVTGAVGFESEESPSRKEVTIVKADVGQLTAQPRCSSPHPRPGT